VILIFPAIDITDALLPDAYLIAIYGENLWAITDYLYNLFQALHRLGEVMIPASSAANYLRPRLRAAQIPLDPLLPL